MTLFVSLLHQQVTFIYERTEHETQALPNLGLSPGSDVDDDGCDVDDVVAAATSVWNAEREWATHGRMGAVDDERGGRETTRRRLRLRLFVCAHARADAHLDLDLAGGKDGLVDVPSVGRLTFSAVCAGRQTTVAKRREAAELGSSALNRRLF